MTNDDIGLIITIVCMLLSGVGYWILLSKDIKD